MERRRGVLALLEVVARVRYPPLPILAGAFATGIALSGSALLPVLPLLWAGISGVAVATAALRAAPRLALPAVAALAFALGALTEASDRAAHPNVMAPWVGLRVEILGLVVDEPRRTATGYWLHRVRVAEVQHRGQAHRVKALMLVRAPGTQRVPPGHLIEAGGWVRPIGSCANFGGFDYTRYAARQHLHTVLVARDPFVRDVGAAGPGPRRLALSLRERIAEAHRRALPADDAALLNSILFGSRATPVPEDVEGDFRNSGIIHLLVASGTQVSAFVGLLLLLRRTVALPAWATLALTLAGACLYGTMAGGGPSIARAGIMAVALSTGRVAGRAVSFPSLLALAALAILWVEPAALFDAGFQLSFAAMWGLIVLQPWIGRKFPVLPHTPRLLVSASAAAQLATAPVLAHHFCQLAPIGIIANLAAVPLAALLLAGGTLGAVAGILSPAAGYLVDTLNLPLLALLRATAWACARVPGGHLWVVPPSALMVAVCYFGLAALPHANRERLARAAGSGRARFAAASAGAVSLGWWLFPGGTGAPGVLRVTFLDVGQGDSILVQSPTGEAMLVDGGGAEWERGDFGEQILLPALLHRGVRRLDAVVATHSHADHAGGLGTAVRDLRVGAVWEPGLPADTPEMARLQAEAARRRVPRCVARAGAAWTLGPETRVTVLHPPDPPPAGADANAYSVILRVDYREASLLLTGDTGFDAEEALTRSESLRPVDVVKAGHHGSASSTGDGLLAAAAPRLAVISVGANNPYSLPSPGTVKRLLGSGALLYRTDEDGAVEVVTDGEIMRVRCARQPQSPGVCVPAR